MLNLSQRAVRPGGNCNNGAYCGLAAANVNNAFSNANVNYGARRSWKRRQIVSSRFLLSASSSGRADGGSEGPATVKSGAKQMHCRRISRRGNAFENPQHPRRDKNAGARFGARPRLPGQIKIFKKMKRVGWLWEKLIDRENLDLAITHAAKGKLRKVPVKAVLADRERAIDELLKIIESGDYSGDHNHHFIKKDGNNGKLRDIYPPSFFPGLVIEWAVFQVLYPIIYRDLDVDASCNIRGRGTHYLKRRVEGALKNERRKVNDALKRGERRKNEFAWAYQDDFKKFFDSIPVSLVREELSRRIKDTRFLDFVMRQFEWRERGVVLGRLLSQHLASFCLNRFDHFMREKLGVAFYSRYMDDILVLGSSREFLQGVRDAAHAWAEERGLQLGKPRVFKVAENCDFCGKFVNEHGNEARRRIRVRLKKGAAESCHVRLDAWMRGAFPDVVHACRRGESWIFYSSFIDSKRAMKDAIVGFCLCERIPISSVSVAVVDLRRVDIVGFTMNQTNTHIRPRNRKKIIRVCAALRRGQYTTKNCQLFSNYWGYIKHSDTRRAFWDKYLTKIDFLTVSAKNAETAKSHRVKNEQEKQKQEKNKNVKKRKKHPYRRGA